MSETLRIAGGHVVDPLHGVDAVRDVWVRDGVVIEPPLDLDTKPDRLIDARGYVVMPGGVDVHCHIAGSKVNAARRLRPEEKSGDAVLARRDGMRSGTLGSVPSTFATGYRYAGLGYTTAVDAAIAPLGARHAHHELEDTPVIDRAILTLLGNNHYVMDRVREGDSERLRGYVAWMLGATKAFGVKVVNPGGVERWKQGEGTVSTLDDLVPHFEVTPRQIVTALAGAVDALALPHPIHVHGLNLGRPGNAATTMDLLRTLDGHRAHLAHIQFHSYDGDPSDASSLSPGVAALAEFIDGRQGITVDVGQVLFGDTTSMTADGAVGEYLHRVTGRKWVNQDIELETGCGVVPIEYRDRNTIHALQWAIGLEWFLRVQDPWKIALSTDHPNGGSFLAYPEIIALLMDSGLRRERLAALPESVRERSSLHDLNRQYTLSEIATITRAAPARMLGLSRKGHLGPGADGDITIYAPDDDRRRMFAIPRWVIKAGVIVVEDGELRRAPEGVTRHVAPEFDHAQESDIRDWFDRWSSIRFRHFAIQDHEAPTTRAEPLKERTT
jgi:formylmethanofuran dehydrogenase subunit A